MRMDVVGPPLWDGLHAITFGYPEAPTPQHRKAAIDLFSALQTLLPCPDCQAHYTRDLQAHPIQADSRDALSRWLVDLHNRVNARLGKRVVPYEEVAARYLAPDLQCGGGGGDARINVKGCPAASRRAQPDFPVVATVVSVLLAAVFVLALVYACKAK